MNSFDSINASATISSSKFNPRGNKDIGGWGSPHALEEELIPLDRVVNEVIETLKAV